MRAHDLVARWGDHRAGQKNTAQYPRSCLR
jgi:hypothetical protein